MRIYKDISYSYTIVIIVAYIQSLEIIFEIRQTFDFRDHVQCILNTTAAIYALNRNLFAESTDIAVLSTLLDLICFKIFSFLPSATHGDMI